MSDGGNDRTLTWSIFLATNDLPADVVLGQSGMTTDAATTQAGESAPHGLLAGGCQAVGSGSAI